MMIKGSIHLEDIITIDVYVPNNSVLIFILFR